MRALLGHALHIALGLIALVALIVEFKLDEKVATTVVGHLERLAIVGTAVAVVLIVMHFVAPEPEEHEPAKEGEPTSQHR